MEEIIKVDRKKKVFKADLDELIEGGKLIEVINEFRKEFEIVDFKFSTNGVLQISGMRQKKE